MFEEQLGWFDGLVIAIAGARHDLAFEVPLLRLDPLDVEDRMQLARGTGAAPGGCAQHPHHGRGTVQVRTRAIAAAAAEGGDLWQACRERASRELEELADRIVPRALRLGRHRAAG
ncbi:MAG: hypothetical protein U1E67_12830 [Hyphomicrobiales bacterium]